MIELREVAHYVSDKIEVSLLKTEEYITTDNMIANRGGVIACESLPQTKRVTRYMSGDVLVSNIRPYFKKIWYADRVSGCSNDVIVFRANDNWNSKFLYYVLSQDLFFDHMMAEANGTKMPRGNKNTIPEFLVPDFDITKQTCIASILSTYDSLIANNQKQIKLLEEAAQRLYKEWFVDLRFPGHEDVAIVDGVPEGWQINELQEVALLKAGGDRPKIFSKERNTQCNIPVYSNGTEKEGLYGYTDIPEIQDDCVTISARGSVGYTCLRRTAFVPIVRLISVIPKKIDVIYLYLYLKNFKFDSNGAAQQQITVPMIKDKPILIPRKEILEEFAKIVHPFQDAVENCKSQIEKLTEARDRLLPKLMSGEIEV